MLKKLIPICIGILLITFSSFAQFDDGEFGTGEFGSGEFEDGPFGDLASSAGACTGNGCLLLENGDYLLLETGDRLLLE